MKIPLSIISDGGPTFIIPLLLLMIGLVVLFIIGLTGKMTLTKTTQVIGHVSLFALVWGFLGSTIGLISAFDAIDGAGGIAQPMMAAGLKTALLSTLFGLVTFLIGRFLMIVLTFKNKV